MYKFLFLFLLIIPFTFAITSTAQMDVENLDPVIELISANFRPNKIIIKARIKDFNGYQDIQSVQIKILESLNKQKVIYNGFINLTYKTKRVRFHSYIVFLKHQF